jgi:hypothetical protein
MLLIDPPVTPYSSPERIQAWVERLNRLLLDKEVRADPESLRAVEGYLDMAREWLAEAEHEAAEPSR